MKYSAVIFDLDGTILNTLEDLCDSVNHTLATHGLPQRTLTEIRHFVGNGIHKLIERAVPTGTTETETEAIFDDFNTYYKAHCAIKTYPYEGIPELLKELRLKGIKTALVSNKADYGVQSLCQSYFPDLFDYAVGEKTGILRKPAPDGIYDCLKSLNIEEDKAVYIGDSEVDLETAANAGMDIIMVSWGFRDEALLKELGAKIVVHTPKEILQYIN